MNRRSVIKSMLLVSAGAGLIPACKSDKNKSFLSLKNISITGDDQSMLAELSATILPTTDGVPGANELSSHLFVMTMVDDCAPKDMQQKFIKGLASFNAFVQKKYNTSFVKCTPEQKAALLTAIEQNKDIPEEVTFFYQAIKDLTIESFTTSQYFLTKVQVYELVPGRYHGCVPVKTA